MMITDETIPKLRLVPLNLAEKSPGTVNAPVFSASFCSGVAINVQRKRIPVTQPKATQMAAIPSEYANPVNPSNSHADSPVARSDKASEIPEIFLPPNTKSLLVFERRAE